METDPGVIFEANPLEWELVTHNLVKNACEACQNTERPTVRVGLEHLAIDKVRLTVSDNGETLSEADFERLTQPLMSVKEEGLGLGLQIGARHCRVARRSATFCAQQNARFDGCH